MRTAKTINKRRGRRPRCREVSLIELMDKFPDEASAVAWFESVYWPDGRACGHCGGMDSYRVKAKSPMPYWCRDCSRYFSVRTGTVLQSSRLPLRKWAFAVWLYVTRPKGISSVQLSKDLNVTQKTSWYMLHRLRQGWEASGLGRMTGTVEVDETYLGGKLGRMHAKQRCEKRNLPYYGKTVVVGGPGKGNQPGLCGGRFQFGHGDPAGFRGQARRPRQPPVFRR